MTEPSEGPSLDGRSLAGLVNPAAEPAAPHSAALARIVAAAANDGAAQVNLDALSRPPSQPAPPPDRQPPRRRRRIRARPTAGPTSRSVDRQPVSLPQPAAWRRRTAAVVRLLLATLIVAATVAVVVYLVTEHDLRFTRDAAPGASPAAAARHLGYFTVA